MLQPGQRLFFRRAKSHLHGGICSAAVCLSRSSPGRQSVWYPSLLYGLSAGQPDGALPTRRAFLPEAVQIRVSSLCRLRL